MYKPQHSIAIFCGFAVVFGGLAAAGKAQDLVKSKRVSFNRDVRVILSNHCFQCHGPDSAQRQADLRLDVPGQVDLQEIVDRITSPDSDIRMPPPESNKPLSGQQIEALRQWIAEGAVYEKHWAFLPPQLPSVPPVADSTWSEHPLDRFVLARLEEEGLMPSPPADKRTLIRRLSLDLTGLPPTLAELQTFLDDTQPLAYERLVDRLLESPQYGEHLARYWLDVVRFADTNGLHHDHYREMTPYRDWVIRAFNNNLPFDQFVVAQVAGDLMPEATTDQKIASGFNRLHLIIDRGTALPEESFMRNVVDQVSAVGTAFLGLTLECAVCHDHKYDPLTQREFYQLYAFFNNFDGEPETGGRSGMDFKRGLQPPYLELPSPAQARQLQQLEHDLAGLQAQQKEREQRSLEGETDSSDEANDSVPTGKLASRLQELHKRRDQLLEEIPATLVMKERDEIRPAHVMIRGNYDQPGEPVVRNTPSFLPTLNASADPPTRLDLAHWLVDPQHPLTARVAVNRFWQQLFGIGLVETSEDFGAQGRPPSHPELLDYLTLRFVRSGWDVKALMRFLVLSQTYQQASRAPRDAYLADPKNRLLARGSRFRLDAEVIRDSVLLTSGLLNRELYGKSVKPPQPAGLWEVVAMPNSYPRVYEADTGDQIYRRSLYSFWKRALPPPQMTIFDAPTRESCIARRERTNTPLQALVLMNEQQYFSAAVHLAVTLVEQSDLNDGERISRAVEMVTSQALDEATAQALHDALQDFRQLYRHDASAARELLTGSQLPPLGLPTQPEQQSELAAWSLLVHSLLNLDTVKTRE